MEKLHHLSEIDKHVLDIISINAVWLSLFGYMPEIALFLTIVWTLIRIWETDTIKILTKRKREEEDE